MAAVHDLARNFRAALALRETIWQTYPRGWWVGIAEERIVADAASYDELVNLLREKGHDPDFTIRTQAGVYAPPVSLGLLLGIPIE